jgi:hypothetical protein
MNEDDEPNLVTSGKSRTVVIDDHSFAINIFRLEGEQYWSLEVVDGDNTSHVWDHQFASDSEARDTAISAIELEGALTFMHGNNIIPFRQP